MGGWKWTAAEEGIGTSDSNYLGLRADDPPKSIWGFLPRDCARRDSAALHSL